MTHRRLPHRAALVAAVTSAVPALVARVSRAVALVLVCALALLPAAAHAFALKSPAPTLSVDGASIARALAKVHLGDSEAADVVHTPRGYVRERMDTGGSADSGATDAPGIVQGHLYDPLSGLMHFGAREYLPEIGQFARPEPLVVDVTRPVTAVAYAYAGGDPVNFEDRDGNAVHWGAAALAGLGVGGIYGLYCWSQGGDATRCAMHGAVVGLATFAAVATFGATMVVEGGATVGTQVATGMYAGAMSGLVGGAISGGGIAAVDGGDVAGIAQGALYGGGAGALGGLAAGPFGPFAGVGTAGGWAALLGGGVFGGAVSGGVDAQLRGADAWDGVLRGAVTGLLLSALGGGAGVVAARGPAVRSWAATPGRFGNEFGTVGGRTPEQRALERLVAAMGRPRNPDGTFARGGPGENPAAARGRQAHRNYRDALGPGYRYDEALPSGGRPDAVDWQNMVVRELKPDNPKAISRGYRQVERYRQELEELTGQPWTTHVDSYRP